MSKQVTVIGGGFAGLAAVQELTRRQKAGLDIRIRLVDRQPCSVFLPLLPDLISGRIRPRHLCFDLRSHCRRLGVEFLQQEVRHVDLAGKAIETGAGRSVSDGLVLALGCETNWHGHEHFKGVLPDLKGAAEGVAIRTRAWELVSDCRRRGTRANIIVIGGGYAGFEIASHIAAMLHRRLRVPYSRLNQIADIVILEVMDHVLHGVNDALRDWSVRAIGHYAVRVETKASVQQVVDATTLRLGDGRVVEDALAVWSAGVSAGPVAQELDVPKIREGRLAVEPTLNLPGHSEVFIAGDLAGARHPGQQDPLRMGIQFSLVGGTLAGRNLAATLSGRPMREFNPADLGYIVPLAPGRAAGVVLGVHLRGRLPYLLHYVMCLYRSWGMANRAGAFCDLLRKRDASVSPSFPTPIV